VIENSGNKFRIIFGRLLPGALVLEGIAIVIVAIVTIPASWLAIGGAAILMLGLWLALLRTGRDFEVLFLLLFAIGYFQGIISILASERIPASIWGWSKYALLGLIMVGYILRVLSGKPIKMNRLMRTWLILWILNCMMFGVLMLEAYHADSRYSFIATIQTFGIGNMILAVEVYLLATPVQTCRFLKLLMWSGVAAALFGIVQRLLGAERLAAFGLNVSGGFFFLSTENLDTNFLDLANGFRPFSFFDSHHGFSAFLILAIVALQIIRLRKEINRIQYWIWMTVLWAGMAVTFNLTNLLTGALILIIFGILEYSQRVKSAMRIFLSKRFWKSVTIIAIASMIAVITIPQFRDRITGIFDVHQAAGSSLYYRQQGFAAGVQAVIDYPFGFGLLLNSFNDPIPGLTGYARVTGYFEEHNIFFSADTWFQWLMVQIGILGFCLYAALLFLPVFWGWRQSPKIRDPQLRVLMNGVTALMTGVFVAGISNSPLLIFAPSNLLIWAAAGMLMKIPSWDAELRKDVEQA
jgi:hypothetical protein